jgi:hypothetical protein
VDADSATIGNPVRISADHENICKFESREGEGYKSVVKELKKFMPKGQENETSSVSVLIPEAQQMADSFLERNLQLQ